jgi:hypothetical protein
MFGIIKNIVNLVKKVRNIFKKYTEVKELISGTAGFGSLAFTALIVLFTLFSPGPAAPVGYDPPTATFHAVSPCATCGLTTAHAFQSVSDTTIWRACSNCDHTWEETK